MHPSTNEKTNIHTSEYYSTIKTGGLLITATTWMNLEKIMLSEKGKTEKVMYHMI